MAATPPRPAASLGNLTLLRTQLGFELLADSSDYINLLLARDGIYEAPETDLVTRILRPGDTCIDAGCHIGYYSCLFAKLVGEKGRVYAFDANPNACRITRHNLGINGFFAEVIHMALAESKGRRPFHISVEGQTGLSSLGRIATVKETISVPCSRLDDFLEDRRIGGVRLLKLDVEGAEEMVLQGLQHSLAAHMIDFILVECFDERLQLLNTSTHKVANILRSSGYIPWEYGTENPAGWSEASEVRSRGDCNYLFSSSAVTSGIPSVSLAAGLLGTQAQRDQQSDSLLKENNALRKDLERLQDDIDWLLDSIKTHEDESARLSSEKRDLEILWAQVQNSTSWHMLNRWRRLRNRLAPEGSWHRRFYESVLRQFNKTGGGVSERG
jgi:FkbM family methyltransferase